ncbi:chitinase [Kitasatospora sp. McL0602]|uniref:chitinase n=1 Tax=Kitasatospora sp. McL0602 TaxID=3439530 RepID=UPI003F8954F4
MPVHRRRHHRRYRSALLAALLLAASLLLGPPSHAVATRPDFPARFAAPYVEVWGPPDMLDAARRETGLRYFTLAFIVGDGGCGGVFDGGTPLDNPGWRSAVRGLREAGGDVIVSFGGGSGPELALACGTVDSLKAAYRRVVDTFDLTRIDLDIEGAALDDQEANDRRNQALAELRREYATAGRALAVDYTLPVNPWGLSPNALALLENARRHELDVDIVNIMTMDYGPDLDMGDAAIRAAAGLHAQLSDIWPEKTPEQLWAMQGNTPMIGVNDAVHEVFSLSDATDLATFAAGKGIRLVSFWSLGRDRPCQVEGSLSAGCSGATQSPYDFARILDPASRARPSTRAGSPRTGTGRADRRGSA